MNPQPPRGPPRVVPPPPRKVAVAAKPAGSGSNSHIKNLGGQFNEAMRPVIQPPSEEMAKLNMAVGGTVSEGLMLRKPTSHAMAGVTSFMPHYKGMSHSFNPTNQNFAQATFVQGGYFPQADHRLI